jgi:protein-tyrosine phosphatase
MFLVFIALHIHILILMLIFSFSDGADRSCIFVALAILVQQITNESRVDVFSVVRKLRSQRQGLFRNFVSF